PCKREGEIVAKSSRCARSRDFRDGAAQVISDELCKRDRENECVHWDKNPSSAGAGSGEPRYTKLDLLPFCFGISRTKRKRRQGAQLPLLFLPEGSTYCLHPADEYHGYAPGPFQRSRPPLEHCRGADEGNPSGGAPRAAVARVRGSVSRLREIARPAGCTAARFLNNGNRHGQ